MVIGTINQDYLDWRPTEGLGGCEAPEATANNNYAWLMLIHIFFFSFQFVKSLVVAPGAGSSCVTSRDENEIGHRVGGQGVFRRKSRMEHHRKKRRRSGGQHAQEQAIRSDEGARFMVGHET